MRFPRVRHEGGVLVDFSAHLPIFGRQPVGRSPTLLTNPVYFDQYIGYVREFVDTIVTNSAPLSKSCPIMQWPFKQRLTPGAEVVRTTQKSSPPMHPFGIHQVVSFHFCLLSGACRGGPCSTRGSLCEHYYRSGNYAAPSATPALTGVTRRQTMFALRDKPRS